MQHTLRQRLLALSLPLILLPATGGIAAETTPVDTQEEEVQESAIRGRFMLMNHYGETVTNLDYRGKFQLITFGYTFCPDICPTTLFNMAQALHLLGESAKQIQPLFVSVDPERDTPKVLREYVAYFHPDIIGLTGPAELVKRAADNFKVKYEKVIDPNRDPRLYAVDHSAGIYLMAPDGQFIVKFAHALPPDQLAERLRAILERS
ncbi:MAG: SCO family protein [Gammaproteobacteria bacterium]